MPAPIRMAKDWRGGFDAIIDVRSPAEYADDHIPGAVNLPVLDDAEHAAVGTAYKQQSPFAARRMGAGMVSRNIARHLESSLADTPRNWQPLLYCKRGGMRSGAMARVLAEIGWKVTVLDGGYRHFRNQVRGELTELAASLKPVLLQGETGTAKTRILRCAARLGAGVLDLEALARHRGSLLGAEPGSPQPGQKFFESRLHAALSALPLHRPVLLEAESSRIGECHIPRALWARMRDAPQIVITAGMAARVAFLKRDYPHIMENPAALHALIDGMAARHGAAIRDGWRQYLAAGDWDALIAALLTQHYDPAYKRAGSRRDAVILARLDGGALTDGDIEKTAAEVVAVVDGGG